MHSQDELSALFSRNLSLEPVQQLAQVQVLNQEPKIVYISAHYNHSAHVRTQDTPPAQPAPRRTSEPPALSEVEAVLTKHHVNTACLSRAQLQLFKSVDDPQRYRLIDLWRNCPPTSRSDNPTLDWSMTSVSQEEILAKNRWEQQQQQQAAEQEVTMSLDGTPLTPIQAGDGRWIAADSHHEMEPYMASGYEDMARREYEDSARRAFAESVERTKDACRPLAIATGGPTFNPAHSDPVYANAGVDWRQQVAMANQYGLFMAYRDDQEML
ncbi:hypothetical protein GE21DRAFT_658 [Neurospora crassa]|uniref:Uncharacterized protein n=2 Tax=Neurospora crassa TaxID=5141 RepID=Q7SG72_NEUCR|nr:hypothetical protein NCU02492 [Neurospora crassa OR74A]EAA35850.1 hypothetical protein NCU02492 [Neurospora crassa OR74A]KHE89917.1 hypothetical protein GE21DRAFT_658 [Neurospora crassa]CAE76393.1 hypothetical protein [Neurospora crassa]|eukprot:XP_965086.1 hypothetical protein NCU02492 [Neurospora crassa OR74A]